MKLCGVNSKYNHYFSGYILLDAEGKERNARPVTYTLSPASTLPSGVQRGRHRNRNRTCALPAAHVSPCCRLCRQGATERPGKSSFICFLQNQPHYAFFLRSEPLWGFSLEAWAWAPWGSSLEHPASDSHNHFPFPLLPLDYLTQCSVFLFEQPAPSTHIANPLY